jgi:TorA maturation chaperone TorD
MLNELKEELAVYNLLRHLFSKEPTREIVSYIMNIPDVPAIDSDLSQGLAVIVGAANQNKERLDAWMEELAVEYARLFIGPEAPPAVPYASVYLSESRSLMTDETVAVRKNYLDAGLSVGDLYSMPDDHVGIELEFIYYLTRRIIELSEGEEQERAQKLVELRETFMKEHFSRWTPDFVDKIISSTNEDFYRGTALLLKGCVYETTRV